MLKTKEEREGLHITMKDQKFQPIKRSQSHQPLTEDSLDGNDCVFARKHSLFADLQMDSQVSLRMSEYNRKFTAQMMEKSDSRKSFKVSDHRSSTTKLINIIKLDMPDSLKKLIESGLEKRKQRE